MLPMVRVLRIPCCEWRGIVERESEREEDETNRDFDKSRTFQNDRYTPRP